MFACMYVGGGLQEAGAGTHAILLTVASSSSCTVEREQGLSPGLQEAPARAGLGKEGVPALKAGGSAPSPSFNPHPGPLWSISPSPQLHLPKAQPPQRRGSDGTGIMEMVPLRKLRQAASP